MTYLIAVLLLALIGCAVTIYRLSGEGNDLRSRLRQEATQVHYLSQRNRDLNAELLNASVTRPNTMTASTSYVPKRMGGSVADLPMEHPQKRKPKSIRGKRK